MLRDLYDDIAACYLSSGPSSAAAFAEVWRSFDPAGGGYTILEFLKKGCQTTVFTAKIVV